MDITQKQLNLCSFHECFSVCVWWAFCGNNPSGTQEMMHFSHVAALAQEKKKIS